MTAPQPAIADIITRLQDAYNSKEGLTDFEKASFRREANKAVPDANAFSALGILACLDNNLDEMHKNHKNAITYAEGETKAIHMANYAYSLEICGMHSEALRMALSAWNLDNANVNALSLLLITAYKTEEESILAEYLSIWDKMVKKPHTVAALLAEDKEDAVEAEAAINEYLEHGGESWEALKAELGV